MKKILIVAVLCCVFASMTAISASYLPSGYYNNVNIGNYQPIGAGPFNTVGFTITSPSSSSLKTEWRSELVYISYQVEIDIAYYTTTGTLKRVSDDFDVPIMGDYSGHTLETPDIDTSRNVYVSVTSRKYNVGGSNGSSENPTANVNLKSGLYNSDKTVILSMNEPGTIYYTLNGKVPTNTSNKYVKPIKITSTTTLKFIALDTELNKSPVYTNIYTIDKIPPRIITTKPLTNSKQLSLTSPIKITFNEKISKGTNFSKIYIKNLNTNKIVKSTVTSLSGNTLTIKMTKSRLSLNTYQVYIPAGAVKDTAGNKNTGYVLKFKTTKY